MAEVELPKPEELHEQAENRFSRRVALVTAVFAVVLAIAALGGNHAMKEMLLSQQQSSDQWAFYQAKVIREHLYRGQKLTHKANDSLDRIGSVVERVEDISVTAARVVGAVGGLTRIGQYAGLAAGVKRGFEVFLTRLKDRH